MTGSTAADRLRELVGQLLVRDADAHAAATAELAAVGDDRVVPHLLEVLVIDQIGRGWERFGFPEVLRERDPPRYLELPEARWPGARDALAAIAEPDYDSPHAWVEWESWYSQQAMEPLAGFEAWKLRLYRSYLPPVGGLLEAEPRAFDLQDVRWGNCDRSFLAALDAPDFVPGEAVTVGGAGRDAGGDGANGDGAGGDGVGGEDAGGDDAGATDANGAGSDPERYLSADDVVFGFEVGESAYAVPRWVLFPHELLNATLAGVPVSLTYCTLCNAPILYDRRVRGDVLTFGSSGLLRAGNKVMYDEETESLWDQHAGRPIAGEHLAAGADVSLDARPVTQTTWGEWVDAHPETLALDLDTGYGYDYRHYEGDVGFFRHYWEDESVVQPGVRRAEGALPEKADVYGIVPGSADGAWVIPTERVEGEGSVVGEAAGRRVVALQDETGDVAVYEAPPEPIGRSGEKLVGGDGTEWEISRDQLRAGTGETRERVPGRHGLYFAFRTHYDDVFVLE